MSGSPMNPFWLVTVPNEGRTPEATFERLGRFTDESGKAYVVQIPSLTVGTLDSLMSLSEEMEKIDSSIEVAVRKIERQYADLQGPSSGGSSRNRAEALQVDGVPVERYLPSFVWEHAKYPHRRALPELVASLRATVGGMEDELKHLATSYADKTQKAAALSRSKGAKAQAVTASAVATLPLEETLPPEAASKCAPVDSEYLSTLSVIVPKASEERFLASYGTLASTLVQADADGAGPSCSPAVPGSAVKLHAEGDAVFYTVCVLKGRQAAGKYSEDDQWQPGAFVDFVAAYAAACKESGFYARSWAYDADAVAKMDSDRRDLVAEVDRLHSTILRWCKAHFAEAFVAWMHLKVIRAFVESVLRYGLPVDFLLAILVPAKNRDIQLQAALDSMFAHFKSQFLGDELDDDLSGPGKDQGADYRPYVLQKAHATSV